MLSDKLKKLRLQKELKQIELANKLSLSSVRYNQYETGKRMPDYELLIKIADFYGVTLDYLLDRKAIQLRNENVNDIEAASLIEKIYTADKEIKSSVEQYLNFLLYQKQKNINKHKT